MVHCHISCTFKISFVGIEGRNSSQRSRTCDEIRSLAYRGYQCMYAIDLESDGKFDTADIGYEEK